MRAAETAQCGSPITKARVPSIGSTTMRLRRERRSKSSAVSSDSQPASGNASRNRRFISASAARSAPVTGEPPIFDSTCAEVRAPGRKYSSASAPASRAAEVSKSRAALASISASTLKGGISVAERKVRGLGFSCGAAAVQRETRARALVSRGDPMHSAASHAKKSCPWTGVPTRNSASPRPKTSRP